MLMINMRENQAQVLMVNARYVLVINMREPFNVLVVNMRGGVFNVLVVNTHLYIYPVSL